MYSSDTEETFLPPPFFPFPGLSCHSRSPSGGVGSRNKRNEDQAGGEGSGLDVRLQQRVRLKSREVLLALWSFSSFPSCLAY